MRFDVVTLFPEVINGYLDHGVVGRAARNERITVHTWNPREYADDKHRTVDDRPYGGGPGMVMKVEPLRGTIRAAREASDARREVIYLSPQGERFTQAMAGEFATGNGLILVAGRYEGIDERVIDLEIDREVSLGDFVMSGGEIAALAVMDTVTRLLPGVLGDDESADADSFMQGLLDFPHYTRPETVAGKRVPEVLLNGDHEAVRRWRLKQALGRTWLRRPDLLNRETLAKEHAELLDEFIAEQRNEN